MDIVISCTTYLKNITSLSNPDLPNVTYCYIILKIIFVNIIDLIERTVSIGKMSSSQWGHCFCKILHLLESNNSLVQRVSISLPQLTWLPFVPTTSLCFQRPPHPVHLSGLRITSRPRGL